MTEATERENELAAELASMHAVLFNLLLVLRNAKHTRFQEIMINQAFDQLKASQSRFPNL
jgi:hypothetical protein